MNRLLASFKVLTFINVKIFTILLFLVASIVIGTKYVKSAERERNAMISNIKNNENEILEDANLNSKILQLDNKILSKSLNRKINYDSINYDINLMKSYTDIIVKDDSTANELNNIIYEKEIVFKKIAGFQIDRVDLSKVKTRKEISLVNTNTKKGLFRTKVEYDTLTKEYSVINKDKYIEEYNKTISSNSKRLNALIQHNNELSLHMKLIIDNYSNKKIINSYKDNENIFDKLKQNIKLYTTISLILLSLIIIFVYLLLVDIKKIKKTNTRNKEAVDILICTAKELRNESENEK